MSLHGENQTGASSMAIRDMSCPDILSAFPLSRAAFPVTSFINTNTHCTAFASPLPGAERSLDVFPSHFPLHFPHLALHEPCPSHFDLTFLPHPLRITQQALICHPPTEYTLSTCFICVFTHGALLVEATALHSQKAELQIFQEKIKKTLLFAMGK